jgi:hypothetical protein
MFGQNIRTKYSDKIFGQNGVEQKPLSFLTFSNLLFPERFCHDHIDLLRESRIRRLTCIVLRHKEFPKYFTYRARNEFREDVIYRHLVPISRISVFGRKVFRTNFYPRISNSFIHCIQKRVQNLWTTCWVAFKGTKRLEKAF